MKTTMRAAFEAAQVPKRGPIPETAKQAIRVMKRQDQRRAAVKRAKATASR
jgi:hypothetical protein